MIFLTLTRDKQVKIKIIPIPKQVLVRIHNRKKETIYGHENYRTPMKKHNMNKICMKKTVRHYRCT